MLIKVRVWAPAIALLVLFTSLPMAQGQTPNATQAGIPAIRSGCENVASRAGTRVPYASPAFNKRFAACYMQRVYNWGSQEYVCLVTLWNHESGWRVNAHNRASGAHGIPQSLPGSKMASVGSNWYSNPFTQIRWGLKYIKHRYGTPCIAWRVWKRQKWY